MATNVRRAFICSGDLKRGTLSETASRPVSDALPLAKAFKIISIAAKVNKPCSSPSGSSPGVWLEYCGSVPFA